MPSAAASDRACFIYLFLVGCVVCLFSALLWLPVWPIYLFIFLSHSWCVGQEAQGEKMMAWVPQCYVMDIYGEHCLL